MRVSAVVMAHPSRAANANKLLEQLMRQQFYTTSITYDTANDEWHTGRRALLNHTDSDWHVVLQDDAIISARFRENVERALKAVPERSLVSFYTGTVRPHKYAVWKAVESAKATEASWLQARTLFWGVGIAIPTEQIHPMLDHVKDKELKYDARIGFYYRQRHMPVYYTWPSIVNHNYKLGSLIGNDYSGEPRKAHRYVAGPVEFNSRVEKI